MKQSEYITRVLEPSEGFVLTQAEDVAVTERAFSEKVYLGVNDAPENWKEISCAEAEELRAEAERVLEQERMAAEREAMLPDEATMPEDELKTEE